MKLNESRRDQYPLLGRWPRGMNNRADIHSLGTGEDGELRKAHDVDLDVTGKPFRRKGFDDLFGGFSHSGFGHVDWPFGMYVAAGNLYRVLNTGGVISRTVHRAVSSTAAVSYAVMNDRLYYSNGLVNGWVDQAGTDHEWGTEAPTGQPLLSAVAGGAYEAGKYQVAITYITADGEESGAEQAAVVTLTANQNIMLSAIPQPAAAGIRVRIYVSGQNGDALYLAREIPSGVTSYLLDREFYPTKMLETQFCSRVPPAKIIRAANARMCFALGPYVFYTEPFRFGLYRLHENYFRFPDNVTMIEPVDGGMYVGTESQALYLSGDDPKKAELTVVDESGVVPGSSASLRGLDFGEEYKGPVVVWWSNAGVLMKGNPNGSTQSMTDRQLSLPRYEAGATMLRERGGMKHLLSVLRNPSGSGFSATDTAVAEVIRGGVSI